MVYRLSAIFLSASLNVPGVGDRFRIRTENTLFWNPCEVFGGFRSSWSGKWSWALIYIFRFIYLFIYSQVDIPELVRLQPKTLSISLPLTFTIICYYLSLNTTHATTMAPTASSPKEFPYTTNGKLHVVKKQAANGQTPSARASTSADHLSSAQVIQLEHEHGAHKWVIYLKSGY